MDLKYFDWLDCCTRKKYIIEGLDYKYQRERSKNIDKVLLRSKKELEIRHHVLLLGTGQSGKSTFLKQLKIINGKSFSEAEIDLFRYTIYENTVKGILFLLNTRQQLGLADWATDEAETAARQLDHVWQTLKMTLRQRRRLGQPMWMQSEFGELQPLLCAVWTDPAIEEAFHRRCEMVSDKFGENTRYFMTRIKDISAQDYRPSLDDIVWARRPTESIVEEEFEVSGCSGSARSLLIVIDVGGQTKERRKWCRLFSGLKAVVFLIAGSQFDEVYHDRFTGQVRNKLREAMFVFSELANHEALQGAALILFFNKTDLLREKLETGSPAPGIKAVFPEFCGDPTDMTRVQRFLVDAFVDLILSSPSRAGSLQGGPRTVYRHHTTAVDRSNIRTVYHALRDTVLQANIRKLMMN